MNLLPLTFAFLGLFNYGSHYEAQQACFAWRNNGGYVQRYNQGFNRTENIVKRSCISEDNKVLGLTRILAEDSEGRTILTGNKVVKRFNF